MSYLEKDLEDFIFKKGEIEVDGINIKIINRQVKVMNYYIDLIGIDDENNIYIFELKKNVVDGNALSQLLNYMEVVETFLKNEGYNTEVRGILIGAQLTDYMKLGIKQVGSVTFINANHSFSFEAENWNLTDDYLKNTFDKDLENFRSGTQEIFDILDIEAEQEEQDEHDRYYKEQEEGVNSGNI